MKITIIRRPGRRRTVSARLVDGEMRVFAPADASDEELTPIVARLRARIEKKEQRKNLEDADLERLAQKLNAEYFQGSLTWRAIAWSMRQDKLAGSCSTRARTIRISHRLAAMPSFVLVYVVMHELAHLLEANHGPRFWRYVNRYPRTERARGYLMAVHMEDIDEPAADLEAS